MIGKRIAAFFILVIGFLGGIAWTSPGIIQDVKLGLDLKGGFEILYEAHPLEEGKEITKQLLVETANALEHRINSTTGGVAEPEIVTEGTNRIRVRLADVEDPEKVREILKKPAELTFRGPDGTPEMIGSDFVEGGARVEYVHNMPVVAIKVKDPEKLEQVTRKLVKQPLAIYLDDELKSNPEVSEPITDGQAIITGNFTYEEAKELAEIINLGALPLKLTEKYTQRVGATLGLLSLEQTVKAGIIGSLLILIFMIVYYRIPGLIASLTLILYTWLLLFIIVLLNARLTLTGIAAFVLGIGMAVDANIITFERIREELRSGKSVLSALKAGSRVSFRTIMDANITTIIAAAALYFIGSGSVQGFALILILSILCSILTNVYVSRFLLSLLVKGKWLAKPGYFGVKEAEIRDL